MTEPPTSPALLPLVAEDGDQLSLHFEWTQVQSRVLRSDPDRLVLDYTRTMMGFVVLSPTPARIAMIGLGGGSLARCCRRALPDADFTAVELSAGVIALRDAFGVPPDGPRFRVLHGDGADWVRAPDAPLDVLLVDGFDRAGQPAALCSATFYDACAARLAEGGVLVVNLNADSTGYGSYVRRMLDTFAGNLVVVETDDRQNKIVFASKGGAFPPSAEVLRARAEVFVAADPALAHLALADTAARIDRARQTRRR